MTACLNCTESFSFQVYSDKDHYPQGAIVDPNGTLLMVIDNTNVIQKTQGYLELLLKYHVEMSLSDSQENFL